MCFNCTLASPVRRVGAREGVAADDEALPHRRGDVQVAYLKTHGFEMDVCVFSIFKGVETYPGIAKCFQHAGSS